MSKKNILIDVKVHDETLAKLKAIDKVSVTVIDAEEKSRPLPAELIADKHFLFCTFPPANFAEMRSLEYIQIASAGYTQLFNMGLAQKGIAACNARGVFDVAIAEWSISMMINLARNLRGMIRNQESGVWDRAAIFQREIRGSTVGFWGYGSIGRETARIAKLMGLNVVALEPNGRYKMQNIYTVPGTGDPDCSVPTRIFSKGEELEFLGGLDFLIMCMPLTNNTKGIMGERELKALPRHACILNPARGPLIEEQSLLKALREGWIAGAALDTHYYYPMPADHPLWRFPNVILTPHISGSSLSPHFTERIWDIFYQNVKRFLVGEQLLNQLTAYQLDGN